ncbi:phage head spike fiber domain-containing protein [Aeromonas rivipollensis]|uniref:phage head spike fiber domain-containing protein n=1 Tax=Aeromonas rivipollensis TaxID=948519 RepID=UPI001F3F0E5C|nr:hypothetical protein [Aeromonas rivipollensis]MCE9956017.1 hypothetical protein [Aeromonas rivipollensis]
MAGLWQRTGNVSVTNGSKTVTGFGTKWKTGVLPIQKGHTFYGPDNAAYEVDTVVSDESILLVDAYRGGTLTNQAYRIDITRTSTISQFAADLASLVGKYRTWFDGMMTWLTGSGDVSILNPDTGANTTIPSWKKVASEGEGQTARAKVEADRSKTEADRSGTEADRAAGIVAAAALPLPDVWAPLTDSLRLFVGNGREVKVGDDVVARYVNYSRSTAATYTDKNDDMKVAAINEPRFERNGLLIGGQSSNLIPTSTSFKNASAGVSYEAVNNPSFPHSITRVIKPTGSGDVWTNNAELIAGTVYTASIYIDKSVPNPQVGVYYGSSSIAASMVRSGVFVGGLERYTATFTCQASGTHQIRFGAYSAAFDFVAGCPQIEALPFASTYQPTTGAAAARAADVATLPQSLNLGEVQLGFSLAVEFDTVNTGPHRILELSDFSSIIADGASLTIRHAGKEVYGINAPLGQRHHIAYSVAADGAITVALNGKMLSPQSRSSGAAASKASIVLGNRWSSTDRPLYGHLRDLKIWTKKPLTADQLKVASA